ncbi:energy transducer TonB [Nibricoccus aquaticus]
MRILAIVGICTVCGCSQPRKVELWPNTGGGISYGTPSVEVTLSNLTKVDRAPSPTTPLELLFVFPPESAAWLGMPCSVTAEISIRSDGTVDSVSVTNSSRKEFEHLVQSAAMNARFTPAILGNRPVNCVAEYRFSFNGAR